MPSVAAASEPSHTAGMAHQRMFDRDDPILSRVRSLARIFPGVDEKVSHGRPAFFTKNVFCYYGGSQKVDGAWVQHPQSIVFLPDVLERRALEADDRFWVPAYVGPSGWLGLDLVKASDFAEVAELIEDSYRSTAPGRLVAELDARHAR